MTENEMHIERDAESGSWDIDTGPPGPAGGAVLRLTDGLDVAVDVADPGRMGIVVVEDFDAGRVLDADLVRVALLAGRAAAARIAGHDVDVPPRDEALRRIVARMALADDRRVRATTEWERDLWAAELAALATEADPRLGLDDPAGSSRLEQDVIRTRAWDRPIDAMASAALDRLAAVLDVAPLDVDVQDVQRELLLDRAEPSRARFDASSDGRRRSGWSVLDPALASVRVFALDRLAALEWDEIDHILRFECALSPRTYAPDAESYCVRVQRKDGVLLALSPLDPQPGPNAAAVAELYLGRIGADAWDGLVVDVTDRPQRAPLSPSARRARLAADYGRVAVTAERLGLEGSRAEAWRRCAAEWQRLDDDRRAHAASARAEGPAPEDTPFAAELVASIRT